MKRLATLLMFVFATTGALAATFTAGSPSTTNNDDGCDIAVLPAATLLLPYFEVDFNSPQTVAQTTLFTVVNTTQLPQIARVTLWTDLAYPVVTFSLFLTGYDVQAINLYDIFGPRATFAPPSGTSSRVEVGNHSLDNDQNPNFLPSATLTCDTLPGAIPASALQEIRTSFTTGRTNICGSSRIGLAHTNAVGYVTVDVVARCSFNMPTDRAYFDELLYDNVLTGDYQVINPNPTTGNYAGGNPLVHIRAIPEGGKAGVIADTNLPFTFYDRYTPRDLSEARAMDRRQPLPAVFATRFVQGGTGNFNTDLRIWREGVENPLVACATNTDNNGAAMQVADIVRFDEHENPMSVVGCNLCLPPVPSAVAFPATSRNDTAGGSFPPLLSAAGDVAGWMYLNLTNNGSRFYSVKSGYKNARQGQLVRTSQNWVSTSMYAEGRYQVLFDALMMANGCTPAPSVTTANHPIAPGANP
jgi:hypothetical protein